MDATDEVLSTLAKKLVYKISNGQVGRFAKIETIRMYKIPKKGVISIPQGRQDLIPADYEIIDKRTLVPTTFPAPKYPLLPDQQTIYDQVEDSCFINALVGWGKTFSALWCVRKLGQKALIIVHTTALRDQWVEEVEKLFGFTPDMITEGKCNYSTPIVVSNVQTLIKFADGLHSTFGTVVVDECLDYETRVDTLEFGKVKIGALVNKKLDVHVLSMDTSTNVVSYKKVLRYFKNPEVDCLKLTHSGSGSIKCTGNHNVFVYVDNSIRKIEAQYVEPGDYLLQTTTNHKSNHMLNEEWKPIILGLILGDGCLQRDNVKSNSVRLRVTHGEDQYDYLDWKSSYLLKGKVTRSEGKSGYGNKKVSYISTKSFIDVDGWYDAMYEKGNKRKVPKSISTQLTAESWALMYQDDGNRSKSSTTIVFSFCELDEASCNNLIASLDNLFGVTEAKFFTCNKGYNYIRLNKEDTIKFINGISGLIHPNLYYKYGDVLPKPLLFTLPTVDMFNQSFCVREVVRVDAATLTGGYKYNIEVEDTHTYFANGLLVSNCHHVPSNTMTNTLDAFSARYRIGLSGTRERKDGKHVMFNDFFGPVVYKPPIGNTVAPKVQVVNMDHRLLGEGSWTNMITHLLSDRDYQDKVAALAIVKISQGYKVLIVSERVDFSIAVAQKIAEYAPAKVVDGSTTSGQRKDILASMIAGDLGAICASRAIFSEGISCNILSCLILPSPMSAGPLLEQLIGRIQRLHPGKPQPVLLDIVHKGSAAYQRSLSRKGFYFSRGWEVETI